MTPLLILYIALVLHMHSWSAVHVYILFLCDALSNTKYIVYENFHHNYMKITRYTVSAWIYGRKKIRRLVQWLQVEMAENTIIIYNDL